ncbi:MAG TPA: hypothetical protein ENG42_01165 [Candidatus Aenigmarchaeota archaeon]|nr:MAG: hypothetical protein DRP03_00770 [Candidatus Aenigmarchaeota archaeon]HDD46060.1 hypothetical protein [Candidatus Aenigmarchaeota archaeon]
MKKKYMSKIRNIPKNKDKNIERLFKNRKNGIKRGIAEKIRGKCARPKSLTTSLSSAFEWKISSANLADNKALTTHVIIPKNTAVIKTIIKVYRIVEAGYENEDIMFTVK